jgi:putative CocE/NonD family hydrolase
MPRSTFQGSPVQYDVIIDRDVMIPMRDGVRLAMDIYRPALEGKPVPGKFPTLIERTPYDKLRLSLIATAKFFAVRGYVCIMQDVRGRFQSEGDWVFLLNEGPDGVDSIEWIAQQPWSDGQIGTIGLSYSTATQQSAAVLNPRGLNAQFHLDGGYNYFYRTIRHSGAFEIGVLLPYVFRMACTSKEALADRQVRDALDTFWTNMKPWLDHLPMRADVSPLKLVPSYQAWFLEYWRHGDYDNYWRRPGANIEPFIDQFPDIPVYLQTSWYGHHVWATTTKFVELRKRLKSPVKLLIGTWIHGWDTYAQSWSGDADFGPNAILDNVNDLRLRWFDQTLKGLDTGVLDGTPVRIFVMGGGSGRKSADGHLDHGGVWRDEQDWPLPHTQWTPYYLRSDGRLSLEPPGRQDPPSSYTFNPNDPVPTIGGGVQNPMGGGFLQGGGFDQRGRRDLVVCKDTLPLASRADVLVFETSPLPAAVEVTGPITVRLWVSSSALDTDFTAKLIDVYPPNIDYPEGYALNLTDSIIRMRYRQAREKAEFMTPGEIYEIVIEPQPTGNLFTAGHRIRLDISSSNFPHFDVNPNTGEPLGQSRRFQVAHNTIYHDAAHPSHVVLPIIPR